MNAHIDLILKTDTQKNARVVLNRLQKSFTFTVSDISSYHKGGMKAQLVTVIESQKWSDIIYESIALAQNIGTGWTITASVHEELFMHCDSFFENGVEFGTLQVLD